MNLLEARLSFPGLVDKVFLDAACVSLIPKQSQNAISAFLEMALVCPSEDASSHHVAMDAMRSVPVAEAAKLLKTHQDNIALVESTSHGINIAANSIPLEKGDNVLIGDTEFLQVAVPWSKKQKTEGIEIKPVQSHDGGVLTVQDFERQMDVGTKVVCVSSVQWTSGFRIDMNELSQLCRDRGVWLVVDAIQEMGAMEIDLSAQYADFLVAGGHKWLNAPFGCGIMFISDRALQQLEPDAFGYIALEAPAAGWVEYFQTPDITPYRTYNFPRKAKTFEIGGTSNYPGAVGLGESLKLINAIGIEKAEQQIRKLTDLLHVELAKMGARIISQEDPAFRSGITSFSYYSDPQKDKALLQKLLNHKIYISLRYTANVGGIRVSTHYYNNEDDILKLVSSIKECVRS